MTAIIVVILKVSILLSVFAIGLKASFADATFLFRRPNQLLRAQLRPASSSYDQIVFHRR